jgi:hypothetical protein
METRQKFNEGMYIAGQRAWRASTAKGLDDETRRALERLSVTYFFGACGIDRRQGARSTGGIGRAPCATARKRGLESPQARSEL